MCGCHTYNPQKIGQKYQPPPKKRHKQHVASSISPPKRNPHPFPSPPKKKQKMIPLFSIHSPLWEPWIFSALVWRTEIVGDHQRDSQRVEGVEANAESFRTVSTLSRVLRATFFMGFFFGCGFFVKGCKKNTGGWKRCEIYILRMWMIYDDVCVCVFYLNGMYMYVWYIYIYNTCLFT